MSAKSFTSIAPMTLWVFSEASPSVQPRVETAKHFCFVPPLSLSSEIAFALFPSHLSLHTSWREISAIRDSAEKQSVGLQHSRRRCTSAKVEKVVCKATGQRGSIHVTICACSSPKSAVLYDPLFSLECVFLSFLESQKYKYSLWVACAQLCPH